MATIFLSEFVICYAQLSTPKRNPAVKWSPPIYSAQFRLYEREPGAKEKIAELRAFMRYLAQVSWGSRWSRHFARAQRNYRTALVRRFSNAKCWAINAKRKFYHGAPRIVDQYGKPISDGRPYDFDICNAIIDIRCYEANGNFGFTADLESIEYLRPGARSPAAPVARMSDFPVIAGALDALP